MNDILKYRRLFQNIKNPGFTRQNPALKLRAGLGGFTLIELLVVIAIIGILSGIVLTVFGSVRGRARDTIRKTDLYSYNLAQEMYYPSNNRYTDCSTTNSPSYHLSCQFYVIYSITQGAFNFDNGLFDSTWSSGSNPLASDISNFPLDPLNGQQRCPSSFPPGLCYYRYAVRMNNFQKFALTTRLENGNGYLVCYNGQKQEFPGGLPLSAIENCVCQ